MLVLIIYLVIAFQQKFATMIFFFQNLLVIFICHKRESTVIGRLLDLVNITKCCQGCATLPEPVVQLLQPGDVGGGGWRHTEPLCLLLAAQCRYQVHSVTHIVSNLFHIGR